MRRAGGFLTGFSSDGGGILSEGVAGRSAVGGCLAGGIFFLGGSFAGGGAARFGGGPEPAFAFTFALSKASLTFAFLTSARPSIRALSGRSPTIFISVPQQTAASFLAPSNESSKRDARASDNGLICGAGMAVGDEERHRAMNFKVPSFTCGFLEFSAGRVSGRISARFV